MVFTFGQSTCCRFRTGRNSALFSEGFRVSISVFPGVTLLRVMVNGLEGLVPGGGIIRDVVIFAIVALPVSNRVTFQSPGIPCMVRALNCDTIGEFPSRSAGTGIKRVTLESALSVVNVQEKE
jgi:hypothetical protein